MLFRQRHPHRRAAPRRPRSARSTARSTRRSTSTSSFYDELRNAVRRARRLRAGVRDRARGRSPRAEPQGPARRHRRATTRSTIELQADCLAGAWAQRCREARRARDRRRRRGTQRRDADRRRHAAEEDAGLPCSRRPGRTARRRSAGELFKKGYSDGATGCGICRESRVGDSTRSVIASAARPRLAERPDDRTMMKPTPPPPPPPPP